VAFNVGLFEVQGGFCAHPTSSRLFLVAAAAYLVCSFSYPMLRYPFFRWALLFRYGRVVLLAQGLCVRSCNTPN